MRYNQEIPVLKCKSLFAALLLSSLLMAQVQPLLGGITRHETGEENLTLRALDVLSIPKVYADDANRSGSPTLESNAQKFFTMTLNVFVVLNWFALMAVQKLLDPDTIFGEPDPATGVRPMEKILNDLWILSRNIVNAIFAFMLLLGGVYLIVSGEGVEAFLKQRMKNFVLAVILVNFSWFFPRVIIDAANVASAVIYNIPNIINKNLLCVAGKGPNKIVDTQPTDANVHADDEACKFVYRVVLFPEQREECEVDPPPPPPNDCTRPVPPNGRQLGPLADIYYADWKTTVQNNGLTYQNDTLPTSPPPGQTVTVPVSGADAVVNGLAVNFANIANLGVIDFKEFVSGNSQQDPWERAGAYMQFFLHLIIHLVLSVAVGLALLAFAVVLIVRMGVLWLCIAFMPFIFVGYAIGKGLGELGEQAGGLNIWKKFISYAFLPAFVAIPFAVGFTLISQLYYVKVFSKVGIFENLGFMPNIDDFHQILWMLIAIAIIWKGVFGVLERTDDIAKGIVGAIKGIGTTTVRTAATAVGYAPVIPTPGGGTTSFGRLLDQYKGLDSRIRFQGRTPPPPEPTQVQQKVAALPPGSDDLKNLTSAVRDLQKGVKAKGSEQQVLDEFAGKIAPILKISEGEARGLANKPEDLRNLLNARDKSGKRVVEDGVAKDIMRELEGHYGKAAGGAATHKIDVDVSKMSILNKEGVEEEFAKKANTALDNPQVVPKDVIDKLTELEASALAHVQEAAREMKSKLHEGMTKQDMKNALLEIQKIQT